jgi:hypothetical protein
MKITERPAERSKPVPEPKVAAPAILNPAWEYLTTNLYATPMSADAQEMAHLGRCGWELVAVVSIPHDPARFAYHFKRRVQ